MKELRRRWQGMGKINEITAPSVSGEIGNSIPNDVTTNPVGPKSYDLRPNQLRLGASHHPNAIRNPHAYDLRPNELRKRARPRPTARRRLTPPFPG